MGIYVQYGPEYGEYLMVRYGYGMQLWLCLGLEGGSSKISVLQSPMLQGTKRCAGSHCLCSNPRAIWGFLPKMLEQGKVVVKASPALGKLGVCRGWPSAEFG